MQPLLFTWNLFMENNGRFCFGFTSCPISSPCCGSRHELRHFAQEKVRWKVFCVVVGSRFCYSDAKVRKCVALKLCLRAVQIFFESEPCPWPSSDSHATFPAISSLMRIRNLYICTCPSIPKIRDRPDFAGSFSAPSRNHVEFELNYQKYSR